MFLVLEIIIYGTLFLFSFLLLLRATFVFRRKDPSLREPPGPLALPIIGHLHLLGPRLHHSLHELSRPYGPLFRLRFGSSPCFVVSSPDLAKEFLKMNELSFSFRSNDSVAVKLLTYDSSFAFAPYGPYWKFIKKLCTYELLGNRNLDQFRPVRATELRQFLKILMNEAKAGEIVNVTEELLKFSSNLMFQMILRIRASEAGDEADQARSLAREVTGVFLQFNLSDRIWFLRNVDLQGIKKKSMNIHKRYDALLEKIITTRERLRSVAKMQTQEKGKEAATKEAKDFLDLLLDVMEADRSEVKLERRHLKALILDLFTAGTDTSASTMDWALAELINNPRVLKKAKEEMDKVVGKQRLVGESDVPNLPYIQAIIKETFRLHPAIPMLARKSGDRDCVIEGYHIPAKSMLFVNIWSIARNPKYWESPLEFKPERFLESSSSMMSHIDVKGNHFQLLPFGTGRRGCPGMPLAMQQIPVAVAAMIQCFDWEVPGGEEGKGTTVDMTERPGLAVPRAHDLACFLKPRIDSDIVLSDP